jgi:arylsulfatase A-like enzyme
LKRPEKEKYHFTEDMTDHAVEWITQHQALAPDKPFLMYWAPGAVHGPHHIFKEWADKYKGKFDDGWDVMRERIFERAKSAGLDSGRYRTHAPARNPGRLERYS